MNDLDQRSRRPTRRNMRATVTTRRFLETAWAAIAVAGLIMLVTALAALAGGATPT
jgi:hypothetical protein